MHWLKLAHKKNKIKNKDKKRHVETHCLKSNRINNQKNSVLTLTRACGSSLLNRMKKPLSCENKALHNNSNHSRRRPPRSTPKRKQEVFALWSEKHWFWCREFTVNRAMVTALTWLPQTQHLFEILSTVLYTSSEVFRVLSSGWSWPVVYQICHWSS